MHREMKLSLLVCLGVLTLLVALLPGLPTATNPSYAQEEPPPEAPLPREFITVSGSRLMNGDQPVSLKGVYYEPVDYSAYDMWQHWDSTRIAHDFQRIRAETGSNVVWVRLPYGIKNVSPDGQVSEELFVRLREMLQIAGNLHMRLVITLFDGYEAFPMPGRNSERLNIAYLETLLSAFATDKRILGWSIYHKPDDHWLWDDDKERVVSWLVRMANTAQENAPNQLVFVALDRYRNAWATDFDGHTLIDFVDVVSLRGSDPDEIAKEHKDIRERTDKPIILYDYKWESGPLCRSARYTEQRQANVYRAMLPLLTEGYVAGFISRKDQDSDSGPLNSWDDKNFYEGLFRKDGTPKPVTAVLREAAVAPLPSVVSNELPYRAVSYKTPDIPDTDLDPNAPIKVEGSDVYVRREFRQAYEQFGEHYNFGLPLMEAFKRPDDGLPIQFFEGAVLVLDTSARGEEGYGELGKFERLKAVVKVQPIGLQYTEGREFPPPAEEPPYASYFPETGHYLRGPFREFYRRAQEAWRFGYPISEELTEEINGVPTTVQYFERGRLEWDAEAKTVQVGHLGSWSWQMRCAATMP